MTLSAFEPALRGEARRDRAPKGNRRGQKGYLRRRLRAKRRACVPRLASGGPACRNGRDRMRDVWGKSVYVRVDLGSRRVTHKKTVVVDTKTVKSTQNKTYK